MMPPVSNNIGSKNITHSSNAIEKLNLFTVSFYKGDLIKMPQNHIKFIKSDIFESVEKQFSNIVFYQLHQATDGNFNFTYLGEKMVAYTNQTLEELMTHPEKAYHMIEPEYYSEVLEAQNESFINLTTFDKEFPIKDKNGKIRWLHLTSVPKRQEDGFVIWNGVQQDITDRKIEENQYKKVNRELKLLNNINDIILKATDENKLINDVFEAILEIGNYKLVWSCSKPDPDSPNQILIPTFAKGEMGYLNSIFIDMNDERMFKGPTATVLLNGNTFVNNHATNSHIFKPWEEFALNFGIRSSIVVPFNINNQVGALNLYSADPEGFDEHEAHTIERIASNLVYGIEAIRSNKNLAKKTEDLTERIKELRCLYQINSLITNTELTEEGLFEEVCKLIPPSFKFPLLCHSRIRIKNKTYGGNNFPTNFPILSKTFVANEQEIIIEVTYSKETAQEYQGPFLKEEVELLDAITNLLSNYLIRTSTFHKLQNSEANLSAIFSSAAISYAILDKDFNVVMLNEEFKNNFKLNTGHYLQIGEKFTSHVRENRKEFVIRELLSVRDKVKDHSTFIVESQFNNQSRYLSASYYPITLHDKLNAILIVGVNVSEEKRLEKERDRIIEDLSARNNDLQQFTHIISHNLRAPVANILGLSRLLNEGEIPEEEKDSIISRIENSSSRLDEVIQDLNKIIQIRREINEIREPLDLENIIREVMTGIDFQIREANAQISINMIPNPIQIITVKSYLISVFYNLISNSLKYSQPNITPKIWIDAKKVGSTVEITYKDNGLGIDVSRQGAKVFGLYQRFHLHKEGKGLGLYLTKTQIELLGGTISLESEMNKGVKFTISIPE